MFLLKITQQNNESKIIAIQTKDLETIKKAINYIHGYGYTDNCKEWRYDGSFFGSYFDPVQWKTTFIEISDLIILPEEI